MASPREMSLVIWVSKRAKGLMDQDKDSLSQITAKKEIVKEDIPLIRAPVCETRKLKLKRAAVVSTSNINDYFQDIYEQ
jgi:hypothetical protein